MKILITGIAGFIGFSLAKSLLEQQCDVVGIDNLNDYYDPSLKYNRLKLLRSPRLQFIKTDICDCQSIERLFQRERFDIVVHLAGQAGVRYSIVNPRAYIESNISGFLNILECCRRFPVSHLLYASSSSVYGLNSSLPYREDDKTDAPASLYAATKKSGELMAHAYSHLYGIPATGLRFFTVYGPWGRPDMAPSIFLRAIIENRPIRMFNRGNMKRDFTYVDDIVRGIGLLLGNPCTDGISHKVYNIGDGHPVGLVDFVHALEKAAGKRALLQLDNMQPGDVEQTFADTTKLFHDTGFSPSIGINQGVPRFYEWYRSYYK